MWSKYMPEREAGEHWNFVRTTAYGGFLLILLLLVLWMLCDVHFHLKPAGTHRLRWYHVWFLAREIVRTTTAATFLSFVSCLT
eukprot:m.363852 g.363852  ORF g.363852 m.363852 type:complete len:83 (-) comp24421_c0_seq1:238-486(-)